MAAVGVSTGIPSRDEEAALALARACVSGFSSSVVAAPELCLYSLAAAAGALRSPGAGQVWASECARRRKSATSLYSHLPAG